MGWRRILIKLLAYFNEPLFAEADGQKWKNNVSTFLLFLQVVVIIAVAVVVVVNKHFPGASRNRLKPAGKRYIKKQKETEQKGGEWEKE